MTHQPTLDHIPRCRYTTMTATHFEPLSGAPGTVLESAAICVFVRKGGLLISWYVKRRWRERLLFPPMDGDRGGERCLFPSRDTVGCGLRMRVGIIFPSQ